MLPILQIGPLAIQLSGLILLIGIWVGLSVAEKHAKKFNIDPTHLYNVSFTGLIAGLLGARLSFIARFPSAFVESPSSIVSLNPGLLEPLGGIAIGIGAAIVYGQRKNLAFLPLLDALTPTFAIMSIAWSLANLASGDGFGTPTELPWAIELWGADRHPTQIYEALAATIILWIIYPGRSRQENPGSGHLFLKFIALTSGAHLLLGAFKGDATFLQNGIRISQIAAWLILALAFWGLEKISTSNGKKLKNFAT